MNWLVHHVEMERLEEWLSSKTVAYRMQWDLMQAERRTGGPRALAGWAGKWLVRMGERMRAWAGGTPPPAEQPADLPHFVPPQPGRTIAAVMAEGRQG